LQPATENPPPATPQAEPIPAPPSPLSAFTPEQAQQFRDLVINLRWLVTEGYVIEYGDGRLFAPPPLPAPKAKAANEGFVPAEAEAPAASAEEEIAEEAAGSPAASEEESADLGDEAEGAEFTDVLDAPVAAAPVAEPATPPAEPAADAV
jgi:hypothetical protein